MAVLYYPKKNNHLSEMRCQLCWRGYSYGLLDDRSSVMPLKQNLLVQCPLELSRNIPWYLALGKAVHCGVLLATVHCRDQELWKSSWLRDLGGEISCLLNAVGCYALDKLGTGKEWLF